VRKRLEPELLGSEDSPRALDEDVQELRRVQRLRRDILGGGNRVGER
jgi:hypothetical protein